MEYNHNKDEFRDSEEKEKPYSKVKYARAMKAEILKGLILRGVKGEKLKSLIMNGSIKGEKTMKKMVFAKSRLARFKLWAVRLTTVVLMWAIVMQLKALFDSFGTRLSKDSFPPPSKLHISSTKVN